MKMKGQPFVEEEIEKRKGDNGISAQDVIKNLFLIVWKFQCSFSFFICCSNGPQGHQHIEEREVSRLVMVAL